MPFKVWGKTLRKKSRNESFPIFSICAGKFFDSVRNNSPALF